MAMLETPLIIFLVIVAPVWIIFHYIFREKRRAAVTPGEDRHIIEELLVKADKMDERLQTLESILDREHPNWRAEV